MRIFVLSVSMRADSNSDMLADAFSAGAAAAGNEVHKKSLRNLAIKPCNSCWACAKNGGHCVIDDDMKQLYAELDRCDFLLIAAPLYYATFPAQFFAFINRLYPYWTQKAYPKLDCAFFGVCADSDQSFELMDRTYFSLIGEIGWRNRKVLHVPGVVKPGDMRNHPALAEAEAFGRSLT